MRALVASALLAALPALAAAPPAGLQPCRLAGVEHGAWCGQVQRPLDPAAPGGASIDVHFAVLPAVARNKRADPVFFFAGGPGQSAMELAGRVQALLARFGNRRDIVLVDQRGTGRSAPLACEGDDDPRRPLRELADTVRQEARLVQCRQALQALPHGDLRRYTTAIAAQDIDAVRQRLGAPQVNLIGVSYGTRLALEVLRQFPQTVRRVVLDGVAPPDMALPETFSADAQAALDAVFAACTQEPACNARHPALRVQLQALLQGLPRDVTVAHPFTGVAETVTVTRDLLLGLVRAPLYTPALAAALPEAIAQAAAGRWAALLGLGAGLGGGREGAIAYGMHLSVVCSEDLPRMAAASAGGPDFGDGFALQYRRLCAEWPRGDVPPAFYTVPPSPVPVLLLSGGADPATPPRHGARTAQALGAKARHVVVAEAGHGLLSLACLRDVVYRFVDAADEAAAAAVDVDCAARVPRPGAFVPLEAAR